MVRVGYVGLGAMGGALAGNLAGNLTGAFDLHVLDRNPAAVAAFVLSSTKGVAPLS